MELLIKSLNKEPEKKSGPDHEAYIMDQNCHELNSYLQFLKARERQRRSEMDGCPVRVSHTCEFVVEICVMLSAGTILSLNVLCAKNEETQGRWPKYLYDSQSY